MIKCEICNEIFDNVKLKANHIRWKHKNKEIYCLSNKQAKINRDIKKLGEIKPYKVFCFKCKKEFFVNEREKKFPTKQFYFCTRSCANTRIHSDETKRKIGKASSKSTKKLWSNKNYVNDVLKNKGKRIFTSKGEEEIKKYFKDMFPNDLWTFGPCVYDGITLVRDLFSEKLKVCIEYDGIWHFKDIHGQLKEKQKKDLLLEEWCLKNGFRLIRIKEEIYKKNKQKWLQTLVTEAYSGKNKITKFYSDSKSI